MFRFVLVLLAVLTTTCAGSSNTSDSPTPTGASSIVVSPPTVSSITVTLANPTVIRATTTNVTGNATLSDGSTQAIASGWRSDSTSVASVTDTGAVTAVAAGLANIFVELGGRRGQAQLKVVHDYRGTWAGTNTVLTCTQTAALPTNFCPRFQPGTNARFPMGSVVTQAADALIWRMWESTNNATGISTYGPPTSVLVASDGSVTITHSRVSDYTSFGYPGLVLEGTDTWTFNMTGDGGITGSGSSRFRIPGSQQDLAQLTRGNLRMTRSST